MQGNAALGNWDDTGATLAYWDNPKYYLHSELWPGNPRGTSGLRQGNTGQGAMAPGEAHLPRLHLVIQCAAQGEIVRGPWQVQLKKGDMALFVADGLAERVTDEDASANQARFDFPLTGLCPSQCEVTHLLPVVLPAGHPATPLLGGMAWHLKETLDDLPPTLAELFLGNLLAALAGTLAFQGRLSVVEMPRQIQFHLQRIKTYLRLHLRNPALSVKDVAQALDLSVSHIHRVFAHEGRTVSDWLWGERLAGCAADLSSPAQAHRSVGEIALAWGFNDVSHFSRAFKKRFGVAPKAWRSHAPWRQPLYRD